MNLSSQRDAIDAVSQHLRTLYKPYEGAQFRLAFFHDGTAKRFLTAYVIFREQHVASRPQVGYRQGDNTKFSFVEHWCHEQWEALKLLSKLLSGEAEIEGHLVEARFSSSDFDHRTYPAGRDLWTGHELRSRRDRDANWRELYIPQGYLVRRGASPYYGPDHAINDWIFNVDAPNILGADVPHKDTVVTFFPDSRARILSADWQRSRLHLDVELRVPPDQVELQILFADSKSQPLSVPIKSGKVAINIPEDVRSLSILLLDDSDNCISSFQLDGQRTKFGNADSHPGRPVYGSTVLDDAENAFASLPGIGRIGDEDVREIGAATKDRQFMEMAIEEARKSKSEDDRVHPRVGVVVVKDGRLLAAAHRGEFSGCHAEYIALENKLPDSPIVGATVYTTLEPCTTRHHPKIPCASRLVERKVARVVIGMLDPNPSISGRGQRALRKARIATELFPHDLMEQIEELNREFTRSNESQPTRTESNAAVGLRIAAATFKAFKYKRSKEVGINIDLRLEIENRGPQTTLQVFEIDLAESPLHEEGLHGFFSGDANKIGERISLEPGYSSILKCSIGGTTSKPMADIPSEISGRIVFRETLTGNLPALPFRAARVRETLQQHLTAKGE